ncbi:hypothetical protein BU26DRAFT_149959 [Trematosphaeria pertusa]|uniref:Uncharacterized protein n=1 Tax=Trematosphaeria pertusa TaxID=390896 RepID=A0A6A6IXB4_9PLEO|nr:uncharacterized protein BU26DRAFT_149959 [Trematosphaeria pertusa]KAF2255034.1 hypothetical protein BU26DRAFT_149959 [Trematosphaeria pertusa]
MQSLIYRHDPIRDFLGGTGERHPRCTPYPHFWMHLEPSSSFAFSPLISSVTYAAFLVVHCIVLVLHSYPSVTTLTAALEQPWSCVFRFHTALTRASLKRSTLWRSAPPALICQVLGPKARRAVRRPMSRDHYRSRQMSRMHPEIRNRD